jgi:two-component system, OmpR family, osmolarity sensor histidine kinase EnvZ
VTFFPRSLLWRTVLLLALLMAAGHFASLQIFRAAEREPRAMQAAQQIASVVNLTRSALITADPAKRLDLLRDLSQQEGVQVYAGVPIGPTATPPERPFGKIIAQELQRRLGNDTRVLVSRDGIRGVWVSFKIDDLEYWVRLPRDRVERTEQLGWIGWGVLILILSLAGAFLIVARINRPLGELTRAATAIGHGEVPPPVVETGPTEVRTLSRAFNQMATDLQRTDADRALLLAGVSHDLRTPLARIRLGVEMLDNKTDMSLKQGMVQDVEDIDAIINQFLDFARITAEPGELSELDINELVYSVTERYARDGKRVTARCGTVPAVKLHPLAMQRLLTNLVDNALRHGGAEVEIETAFDQARMRLSVLDRGPGIPAAETARMLQPFTRLNEARSTAGSGLGLAIVDRIAKLHGGSVQLLAREGGGLEARIEFAVSSAKT